MLLRSNVSGEKDGNLVRQDCEARHDGGVSCVFRKPTNRRGRGRNSKLIVTTTTCYLYMFR